MADLYDTTKDIKQAGGSRTYHGGKTLKHAVKGWQEHTNTAAPIASAYGLGN